MPETSAEASPSAQQSRPAPGAARLSRRTTAVALAVLSLSALAGAWQDFTLFYLYHQADLGYVLQVGARIAAGQTPYRDFIFMWPPLTGLAMAASFRAFGMNLWAAKLPVAFCVAAAIPLAYRWLRTCVSRPSALAGAVMVWALGPVLLQLPYAMYYALAPAFLVFQQLERMRPGRMLGPACLIGVTVGVALGVKHNIGILLGLAAWVRVLCLRPWPLAWRGGEPGRPLLDAGVRGGAGLVALGALLHLGLQFPVPWTTAALVLGPAALFTIVGTRRGLREAAALPEALPVAALARACAVVACGAVAIALPWLVWLHRAEALEEFLRQSLIVRPASPDWGNWYPRLLWIVPPALSTYLLAAAAAAVAAAMALRSRAWAVGATAACVALAACAVALERDVAGQRAFSYAPVCLLPAGIGLAWTRSEFGARVVRMFAGAAWFLALGFPAATAGHMTVGLAPALALAVALAWARSAPSRRFARVGVVGLGASLAFMGWHGWIAAWRVPTETGGVWRAPARIPGERGGTWTRADVAAQLVEMRERVDRYAPPGAPLVGWPALGLLNFYTGRPNPTRLDLYWPGFVTPEVERLLVAELEAAAPRVVVLNDAPDLVFGDGLLWTEHPALAAYIDAHYLSVGTLGTWNLRVRATDAGAAAAPRSQAGLGGAPQS